MFDVGFFELLLIGVVGLLVLGPERLPRAARMVGLWMRRARATWYSVRSELERELADEDLKASLKREAGELNRLGQSIAAEGKALSSSLAAVAAPLSEAKSADAGEPIKDEPGAPPEQQQQHADDEVSAEDQRAMREPLLPQAEAETLASGLPAEPTKSELEQEPEPEPAGSRGEGMPR